MMYGPIRAVAIDDRPTHLLAISTGLAAAGIPCMTYWYDKGSNSLVPEAKPHEFIRLLFMDLNLAELGANPDPKTMAGVVIDVLEKIISPDAGPYLLIFWTEIAGKIEEVRRALYERIEKVPPPLDVLELSKRAFLPILKGEGKDLDGELQALFTSPSGDLGKLADELTRLTNSRPELSLAGAWESRAAEAAAKAINEIAAHARRDVGNPVDAGASLKRVLATIARRAVGEPRANADPARSLDAGMSEILNDQFSISVDESGYPEIVRVALEAEIKLRASFANQERMAAALNRFFHVDLMVQGLASTERGVVLPGKTLFTEELLGATHLDLFRSDFMLIQSAKEEAKKRAAEFEQASELVLVEVGADCDHAQAKPRTLRYLVGFEFPAKYIDLVRGGSGKLKSDALQLLGPWDVNGGICLVVSCRRFFSWQDSKPPSAKVKYRLRNSLVGKLLHHYSNLSSRPGIVDF